MVRIVKAPDERRSEILTTAKELFSTKGYENTTINEIIQVIGIAKGTFYHYFKSKEEIADAVIHDAIVGSVDSFRKIDADPNINAIEKLSNITRFFSQEAARHYEAGLMAFLHHKDNVTLHLKMKVAMVKEFVPIIANVVRQGVKEGSFKTDYPEEVTEFLLIGLHFMLDPSFFSSTKEEFARKLNAISEVYEKMLGAPEGSFSSFREHLKSLY